MSLILSLTFCCANVQPAKAETVLSPGGILTWNFSNADESWSCRINKDPSLNTCNPKVTIKWSGGRIMSSIGGLSLTDSGSNTYDVSDYSALEISSYMVTGSSISITVTMSNEEHRYSWTTVTEPQCMSDGEKYGVCNKCGVSCYSPIPATGHNYVLTSTTLPTCINDGKKVYVLKYISLFYCLRE